MRRSIIFILVSFFISVVLAEWVEMSEPYLKERLSKVKFVDNQGILLVNLSDKLPEYSDITCTPAHGRAGVRNLNCLLENVCYSFEKSMFEISPEGYRENFDLMKTPYFNLRSYQEAFRPDHLDVRTWIKTFDKNEKVKVLNLGNPALLINRFLASNIMHALHDDLLPILFTIAGTEELRDKPAEVARLILSFNANSGTFDHMYNWFGQFQEIHAFKSNIPNSDPKYSNLTHICFQKAIVGLSTSSQWYQYGFKTPEGPIPALNKEFTGGNLQAAVEWIKRNLDLDPQKSERKYVSIVSRKMNRLILNEDELVEALGKQFPDKEIKLLNEQVTPMIEMIKIVHESEILVGMHGALLALSLFLQPGTTLIELFFFGVNSDDYTPYKTLAELLGIKYKTWTNPHEDAPYNIIHENRPYFNGGISHFPASYQDGIKSVKMVPKHKCCYYPFWTFRLFQDTHVNITAVIDLIKN